MISEDLIKKCKDHFNKLREDRKSETFHGLYKLLETEYSIMDVVGMVVQNMSQRVNKKRLEAIQSGVYMTPFGNGKAILKKHMPAIVALEQKRLDA